MNRRLFLLAATFLATAPALAAGETPEEIVAKIYKVSAGKKGDYAGESAFGDPAIRRAYFSKAFVAALVKMDKKSAKTNEPILDFDPVTSSQDPSVKRLKIEAESTGADQTDVTATFYSFDATTPTIVHYLFVSEGGGWRVDDITGDVEGEKWSVREIAKG